MPRRVVVPVVLAVLAACEGGSESAPEGDVVRRTVGDTVEVITTLTDVEPRSVSEVLSIGSFESADPNYVFGRIGSIAVGPDGDLYVLDAQASEIRRFDPTGQWVRSYGRRGEGPGEFGSPNSSEVRVVDSSGDVVRATPPPFSEFEIPVARAEVNDGIRRGSASATVPFGPQAVWTVYPTGAWVGGISREYRIDMWGPERDGVLRFGRRYAPVEVDPDERQFFMDRIRTMLRNTDPNWDWDGLEVPRTKPPFTRIYAGLDGRAWVRTSQPGITRPDPQAPDDRPDAVVWTEPVVFDVFSPSGKYLMTVAADPEMSLSPTPVFRGDTIWSVARDELDVAYVKKWVVEGD